MKNICKVNTDSLSYRIAFAGYRNITNASARTFTAKGIDAESFFKLPARTLATISGIREEYFSDDRRAKALENAIRETAYIQSTAIRPIFFDDELYPEALAQCDDAPALLYTLGELPPASARNIAIVGTRHCTAYGAAFTADLVKQIAEIIPGATIISGLAYGIDIAAHREALKAGIPTGAILAHGLNTVYPADHRDEARRIVRANGFLATEYASGAPVHRGNFLARNRIVAGMAHATIVIESDIRGGAMTTARLAGEYGREVMAVPGRIGDKSSQGCNQLIALRQASLIRSAEDLASLMGWPTHQSAPMQKALPLLTDEQQRILDHITANPSHTVNDMCLRLDMPCQHLSAILFRMEIDGIIISVPGGRFAPVPH